MTVIPKLNITIFILSLSGDTFYITEIHTNIKLTTQYT